mgnify:CR=1 FL=1
MTKREQVMDMLWGSNRDIKESLEDVLNRIADAWEYDNRRRKCGYTAQA